MRKRSRITVLVADDHPLMRRGIADVLRTDPNIELVAEAGDGEAALRECESKRPAVVVLDIQMPRRSGFEVAEEIQKRSLGAAVLLITAYKDRETFEEGMRHEVSGLVLKESAADEIVAGIKQVAEGGHYLSPSLAQFVFDQKREARAFKDENPGLGRLSQTELLILKMISEDRTSKEIANELNLSFRTVDNHRANAARKLELHGTHSLLKFAFDNKVEVQRLGPPTVQHRA